MPDATTRVLTAHVPLPLAERVDRLAERLDRSRGWIIRQALAAWIDEEEARSGRPLDAPERADARREA
nr:ribbon-helix-helix domain-containing protein [Paraburkholderia tagetis]